MSEKALIKECCQYLDKLNIFYYAIPAVLFTKKQGGFPVGYKKGMPDLCIPRYQMYIEFKQPKMRHPETHLKIQAEVQETLKKEGCSVYVVKDLDMFKKVICMHILRLPEE